MDWTSTSVVLTIVGSCAGISTWFYKLMKDHMDHSNAQLSNRIEKLDAKIDQTAKDLRKDIKLLDNKFETKFDLLQKDLAQVNSRISNIEGQITQMTRPNVIRIEREDLHGKHHDNEGDALEN